jgi:hypothetical protein
VDFEDEEAWLRHRVGRLRAALRISRDPRVVAYFARPHHSRSGKMSPVRLFAGPCTHACHAARRRHGPLTSIQGRPGGRSELSSIPHSAGTRTRAGVRFAKYPPRAGLGLAIGGILCRLKRKAFLSSEGAEGALPHRRGARLTTRIAAIAASAAESISPRQLAAQGFTHQQCRNLCYDLLEGEGTQHTRNQVPWSSVRLWYL